MDQALYTVRLCKVPDGTELELEVSPNTTLQTLSIIIDEKTNKSDSPYRFVLRGTVCPTWRTVLDLQLNNEDIIYYLKDDTTRLQQPPPQISPAHRLLPADPMRDLMGSPLLQSLLDNPNLLMAIVESNPHINAMRQRSPEINALFDDPQAISDLFRTMRNPVMAREMVRTTDRALSNVDAMPGGFDALRQLYHDVQEPVWDSLLSSHSRTESRTQRQDYLTDGSEQDQPFPQAWPAQEGENMSMPPNDGGSYVNGMYPFETPVLGRFTGDTGNGFIPQGAHSGQIQQILTEMGLPGLQLMPMQSNPQLEGLLNWSDLLSHWSNPEPVSDVPARERYRSQLEALRGMGFSDEGQCLEALERHNGSVNRALDDLLQSR